MQGPLDKVVFIQKVAAFSSRSLPNLIRLAYVNQSWADTTKNFSFHLFEQAIRQYSGTFCRGVFALALTCDATWLVNALMSDYFVNCNKGSLLAMVCQYTSSPEIAALVLERFAEASSGGTDAVKAGLTVAGNQGQTCVMLLFKHCSSPEMVHCVLNKIVEVGGMALLLKELTTRKDMNQFTTLTLACRYSSSPQVMKILLGKIVEVGRDDLLKSQISTCLSFACANRSLSAEVLRLIASLLHHFGIFKLHYNQLPDAMKKTLNESANIADESWKPDAKSVAEMKTLLEAGSLNNEER